MPLNGCEICQEYAQLHGIDLRGRTFIVQGFGNVGWRSPSLTLWDSYVGVGDHTGYMVSEEGFNVHKLCEYVQTHRCVKGYDHGKVCSLEEFFSTPCDFVVPAALEMQITEKIAETMKCTAIFEANSPATIEADAVLAQNIAVIPDVLANWRSRMFLLRVTPKQIL